MSASDERARGGDQLLASVLQTSAFLPTDAGRGGEQRLRHRQRPARRFGDHAKSAVGEVVEHLLVMHKFAVNRDGFWLAHVLDDGESIANAEAHAQDVGFDDFHEVPFLSFRSTTKPAKTNAIGTNN